MFKLITLRCHNKKCQHQTFQYRRNILNRSLPIYCPTCLHERVNRSKRRWDRRQKLIAKNKATEKFEVIQEREAASRRRKELETIPEKVNYDQIFRQLINFAT